MAYRLIPVRAIPPDDQIADVNTDVMYDNLMNKLYLNLSDPAIFVSEDSYRSSMNMRNNFGRMAQALVREGKNESAIMICDRAVEMMTDEVVSYDFFMVPIADAYYAAGATDKGNEITEILFAYAEENLAYYFSFSGGKAEQVDKYQQQYMAFLREIIKLAERHRQSDLQTRAQSLFDEYYQKYVKAIT